MGVCGVAYYAAGHTRVVSLGKFRTLARRPRLLKFTVLRLAVAERRGGGAGAT